MLDIVKQTRDCLGFTQAELAQEAGLSLATIQNIEGGRANPSLSAVESIFKILGLEIEWHPAQADWDVLAACGAPVSVSQAKFVEPTAELLLRQLRLACLELSTVEAPLLNDKARKQDAVQALLLALKAHYPRFFKKHCEKSPVIMKLFPRALSARLLKLKRLATASLAAYL